MENNTSVKEAKTVVPVDYLTAETKPWSLCNCEIHSATDSQSDWRSNWEGQWSPPLPNLDLDLHIPGNEIQAGSFSFHWRKRLMINLWQDLTLQGVLVSLVLIALMKTCHIWIQCGEPCGFWRKTRMESCVWLHRQRHDVCVVLRNVVMLFVTGSFRTRMLNAQVNSVAYSFDRNTF